MRFKRSIQINHQPSIQAWEDYLSKTPHSTIFHTPEMYSVFQNTKNYKPLIYTLVIENEIAAMLNPVLVTLKSGLMKHLTTRAIHYGGPLYLENKEAIDSLFMLIPHYLSDIKKHALFSEFRNLSDIASIQVRLEKTGWKQEPHINYWIHLERSLDDIWNDFHKSARRNIKLAEKKGVIFEEITDIRLIPKFYEILQRTFTRKNISIPDHSLFEQVFKHLVPKGYARFELARANDHYFACFLSLLYRGVIYLFYTADDFTMRNYYPTDGYIWHILKWGHQNGYHLFDFGWAGRRDQPYGVRQFKEKFGGPLIEYGRHIFIHKPLLLRLSKLGYALNQSFGKFSKTKIRLD
jgi:serine/alanine adding enzyme